ncbi:hypothetical protein [Pseudomonas sp. SMV7]|uniref:hypothetical protein n=1 Tax=Pseudomonas sp. SMV7 TaxID=3390194 RepID=UPI003F847F7C
MILFAPAPTGSGHNMRVLSIGRALRNYNPDLEMKVALASLQDVFTPMFESSGIDVIDVAGQLMDYSKKSNLSRQLDWGSYIAGYISNTFLSSERMLAYLAIIEEHKPRVVISDFNMAACLAAIFSRTPFVFVTERYDFTLCQLTDQDLSEGGFELNAEDLKRARTALHKQFSWMIEQSQLVLTDKPYIPEMDDGTPVASALMDGKAHFVGPMIRDFTQTNASTVRADLGLGDGPFIVASISGTTMFAESKQNLLNAYLEAFEQLRSVRPELKMVLLGRQDIAPREGLVSVPYYPDWMGLLREASLLVSAPGWITVTEIAALHIPTLFVLPSKSEYHEAEALDRLARLGFPTYLGCEATAIAGLIDAELDKDTDAPSYFGAHQRVAAPDGLGAQRAASRILSLTH